MLASRQERDKALAARGPQTCAMEPQPALRDRGAVAEQEDQQTTSCLHPGLVEVGDSDESPHAGAGHACRIDGIACEADVPFGWVDSFTVGPKDGSEADVEGI